MREILWKNPEWIDDYLAVIGLPEEKTVLLKSWHDHHKKGMFILVDYKPECAVVIGQNEKGEDRLYGVKGISNSIACSLQRNVPIQLETVLLPFKDKIIYDTFISTMPISFGDGAKQMFSEMYKTALGYGIITRLG